MGASQLALVVKNHLPMQETKEMWVWSLGWKYPMEEAMATHSSTLAWRIPWTEEPGGLSSMWLQRVGHDWSNSAHTWDLWDTMKKKKTKTHSISFLEEEKEKGTESTFTAIMAEDFPNLEGEINTQIHKAQKTQNRLNPNRATLRHVIIKLLRVRDKERILKAARENREVIYKKSPTRPSIDFSAQTFQARRERG